MKVNTNAYQGSISKTAKVYTNDPLHKIEVLRITAFIKASIYLSTSYVYLRGLAAQPITKTIRIKAGEDKPLRLELSHFDLSEKVTYRIEEVEAGKVFRIYFTSIPGPPKTYQGVLKLKTNYPEKPEITIRIRGIFKGQNLPVSLRK